MHVHVVHGFVGSGADFEGGAEVMGEVVHSKEHSKGGLCMISDLDSVKHLGVYPWV